MSTADDNIDDDVSSDVCANCGKGKESSNSLKACTACKLVKYCNRECQIAHRHKHKKKCDRRVSVAELHDDEKLFKQPPSQYGDCPICFLRMPFLITGYKYKSCCGKVICSGCIHAPVYDHEGNEVDNKKCSFCRTPTPESYDVVVQMINKRADAGDANAINHIGNYYEHGKRGYPQDYEKALEFYHRAGELGFSRAYYNIGNAYRIGNGVEVDNDKARHYYELAAMGGDAQARHNLGVYELNADNTYKATKHYMIAVRSGCNESLDTIRKMVTIGYATKDDYKKALESCQSYLDEIKSDPRDKAAAADEEYKYY